MRSRLGRRCAARETGDRGSPACHHPPTAVRSRYERARLPRPGPASGRRERVVPPTWRGEAAGRPCHAPSARERGRAARPADRRAVGGVAARFGRQHRPGLRLAPAQGSRAGAWTRRARAARVAAARVHAADRARPVRRAAVRPAVGRGPRAARGRGRRRAPPSGCVRRSPSGVGLPSPTSPTSASPRRRPSASRSSGSRRSRTGSMPTSRSAARAPSWASSASWSRSIRCGSGCGRS